MGIREYYRRSMNGNAGSEDLQAALEAVSGRELGWFFHQWLAEPGYPVITLDSRWEKDVRAMYRQIWNATSEIIIIDDR